MMTTTEFLKREIRRAEISLRHAKRKPNTPEEELRGLYEKIEHLREALDAVKEHWQRVHEERGWSERKPLTLEQLRVMANKPYWHVGLREDSGAPHWSILDSLLAYHPEDYDYGKTWLAYAYPAARIDRKKWEPCEYCQRRTSPDEVSMLTEDENGCENGMFVFNGILACNTDGIQMRQIYFCPICGRPLTDEAWAELERRVDSCQ